MLENMQKQDAVVTSKPYGKRLKRQIENEDVQSIFDLETELFPCLVDMRFLRSERVDVQEAAHTIKTRIIVTRRRTLIYYLVKKETGIDVQIWAARSIEKIFDKRKT